MDYVMLGSTMSLRSFTRFGSAMSIIDYMALGSSLSLRSFARVGSVCSVRRGLRGIPHGRLRYSAAQRNGLGKKLCGADTSARP